MMRTIEVLMAITILVGAFTIASFYAVLPSPRQVSPINLRRLALTTLQALDTDHDLSEAAFKNESDPSWSIVQVTLSACLPPNIVYNLTVYEVQRDGGSKLFHPLKSISNAESLGAGSDAATYLVASSNVTFNVIPEKIGERGGGGTLYILNCSDANGWWITGYTAQSLAEDLHKLLSPYFQATLMVQNTTQLVKILNNTPLQNETVQNAVVVNTFGEAVPIPSSFAHDYSGGGYSEYSYQLGKRVAQYNWTWVSIVGYPLYYVSNTNYFTGPSDQNTYGIYGMKCVGPAGFNAFLQGLDYTAHPEYEYDDSWITESLTQPVYLSDEALEFCNYYGIYPSAYQMATRALPSWITSEYHLQVATYVFNPADDWIAGAVFKNSISGSFLALGLTRTPDVRLTALGLLCYYQPRLYRSEYTASGTSRVVVLELGVVGGV
jgi:hypothetical protein